MFVQRCSTVTRWEFHGTVSGILYRYHGIPRLPGGTVLCGSVHWHISAVGGACEYPRVGTPLHRGSVGVQRSPRSLAACAPADPPPFLTRLESPILRMHCFLTSPHPTLPPPRPTSLHCMSRQLPECSPAPEDTEGGVRGQGGRL